MLKEKIVQLTRKFSSKIENSKRFRFAFSFRYTPSTSLFGFRTTGQVGVYDQGGFIKLFGSTLEQFQNEMVELKEKFDDQNGFFFSKFDRFVFSSLAFG